MGGYAQYSDIHGDGLSSVAAAAAAASGAGHGGFSAYLDNSAVAAAAYSQSPYSIYGQHHPAHSLHKSIRGHDFGGSSYPAEFASAAAAAAKPAPAVPTYKWMQVKRNVPKPGESQKNLCQNY